MECSAKKREYWLTAKKIAYIATNLTLSVVYIRRKLLKTMYTEDRSVHTNSDSCNIRVSALNVKH